MSNDFLAAFADELPQSKAGDTAETDQIVVAVTVLFTTAAVFLASFLAVATGIV